MEKRKRKGFGAKFVWLSSRIFNRKPKFVYKEDISKIDNAIIICNHNYERGPTKWSNHFPYNISIWGNYTFTRSARETCHALTDAMLRGGKPKFWAKIVGTIGGPFVYYGFKHSNIIPVYRDMRMYITFTKSIEEYEKGHNILLFPDDNIHGFKYEIRDIMPGFLILARQLQERGHDPYIICAQESPKAKMIVLDKPIKLSELDSKFNSDEEILEYFKNTINGLYPNYCKEHGLKKLKNKRKRVELK